MLSFRSLVFLLALPWSVSPAFAEPRLTYVNGGPQFNVTERFFALYVGVWRGFDDQETDAIRQGASLLARRHIAWQVAPCVDPARAHQDHETLWTYDQLRLDENGAVRPIAEANRPGYRYFSMANINGLYLRGTGEFKRPKREPGETSSALMARVAQAKEDWWTAASPQGTRGVVEVHLEMRLVDDTGGPRDADLHQQFLNFADYARLGAENPALNALLHRTAPTRWPVYYDERAHKPHSFSQPELWRQSAGVLLRQDEIRVRLEWDWCDGTSPLIARLVVPAGGRLPPGPNRNGRTDHGPAPIAVVEE